MLKFKKYLSVLLAVAMILSSVSVFAEGENTKSVTFSDLDANTTVGKAVAELVPYGIISGYPDGTFGQDKTITRAEFAKIIVTFLNLQNIGTEGLSTGFADVDQNSHWGQPYIRTAIDRGIILGYPDGTFKPDNPVKYCEAVKMMVCALNYGEVAASRTQPGALWYTGYIAQAADIGILKNISIGAAEDPASRGLVAILTSNSLDAEVAQTTVGGSGTTAGGTTAREEFLKTTKITGIVVSCQQTNIEGGTATGKLRLIEVDTGDGAETYMVPVGTDTLSLLGYKIDATISEDSSGDYPVIATITKTKANKVVTVDADDIDSISTSSVEYWESDVSTSTEAVGIENDASFIYNGKVLDEVLDTDLEIKAGNIVLLSNDGDKQADVVFINDCEVYAVKSSSVDTATKLKKIYTLYTEGDEGTIIVPQKSKYVTVNNKGTEVEDTTSFSVSKYDIINLYRSKDGEVFNMVVTRNQKSGSVTEISANTVSIKNVEYKFAYNFKEYDGTDKPVFISGNNARVYLDAYGKIAAAENMSSAEDSSVYLGYILGAEAGEGINGKNQVRMYGMSSGKTGERNYELAENVRVDGTLASGEEAVGVLETAAAKANANKGNMYLDDDYTKSLSLGKYAQFIRYTLDSDGKIDTIDTVSENAAVADDDLEQGLPFPNVNDDRYGKDITEEDYWAGKYKFTTGNIFVDGDAGTIMGINSNTRVLVVPIDNTNISAYKQYTGTSYFNKGTSYRVEGYCLNETNIAKYVIVYAGKDEAEITSNANIAIAGSIKQVTSQIPDLQHQDALIGWNFKSGAAITEQSPLLASEPNLFYGKIRAGEIFRYALDDKYASKTEMVLDIEVDEDGVRKPVLFKQQLVEEEVANALAPVTKKADAIRYRDIQFDAETATKQGSSNRIIYGTVVSKSQDDDGKNRTITLTNTIAEDGEVFTKSGAGIFTLASNAKIFVIDLTATDESKVVIEEDKENGYDYFADIVTVTDVEKSTNDIYDATQVLMFYASPNVRTMFIIKKPKPSAN